MKKLSSYRELKFSIAWSALETWGAQFLGFATMVILARKLTPADFGVLATAQFVVSILNVFVQQGVSAAIVQARSPSQCYLSTAFWSNLASSIVLAGTVTLGASLVADGLGVKQVDKVIRLLCVGTVISSLVCVQEGILQREMRFRALAKRRLIAATVGGFVAVALAVQGCGVGALVALNLVSQIVATVLVWLSVAWRPSWCFGMHELKDLWQFSSGMLGNSLLVLLTQRGDITIVTSRLGAGIAGVYSVSQRIIALIVDAISGVLMRVAYADLARLQATPPILYSKWVNFCALTSSVATPIFLILGITSAEVLPALLGDSWRSAGEITSVLAVCGYLNTVKYCNGILCRALGRPNVTLFPNAVNLGVGGLLVIIFVRFGVTAVAASWAIAAFASTVVSFRVTMKTVRASNLVWEALLVHGRVALANILCVSPLVTVQLFGGWKGAGGTAVLCQQLMLAIPCVCYTGFAVAKVLRRVRYV